MAKQVSFYFDFISPYSFLAWNELLKVIARNDASLRIVPTLFAGLLNAHGQKGPAEMPAKREYIFRDLLRWCQQRGENVQGPPAHPFNPLPALRLCEAVMELPLRQQLTQALLHACWKEGCDISDKSTLARVAAELGLDAGTLMQEIESADVKARLRENTDEAIRRKVFGVPTCVVDDELFWGHDRLAHLDAYLSGGLQIDERLAAEMMARPRAADRKQFVKP